MNRFIMALHTSVPNQAEFLPVLRSKIVCKTVDLTSFHHSGQGRSVEKGLKMGEMAILSHFVINPKVCSVRETKL